MTPEIAPLVASYKKDVQGNINEGFRLKWELILKLDPYVRKLSSSVNTFKDKVDDLVIKYEEVTRELESLKVCKFNQATFTEISLKTFLCNMEMSGFIELMVDIMKILGRIQKVVDELNLASYSNLDMWVSNLDKTVESILGQRLQEAVTAWIALIEEKEDKAGEEGDAEARRLKMGSRNRCVPTILNHSSLVSILVIVLTVSSGTNLRQMTPQQPHRQVSPRMQ